MHNGNKIACVLPAYNAERTLEKTVQGVPLGIVDLFILVDDCSRDNTARVARRLATEFPLTIIRHGANKGYGASQKTSYREALAAGADVVVMLHPDYQYEPKLLGCLVGLVTSGVYDLAIGSRILSKGALTGGMPIYKYVSNRVLTLVENLLIGQRLSEFHTGYRAYARYVLEAIPFEQNSDDFIFDNELLVQCHLAGFKTGEITVPTKYARESSSIGLWRSVRYGLGVIRCSWVGFLIRSGTWKSKKFPLPHPRV